MSKFNRRLVSLLLMSLVIVGLISGIYLSQQKQEIRKKAAGNGVTLSLSPANISVSSGETFSVAVTIDTGIDNTVTAAELHFTYDQTRLEAQSIAVGDYLPVVLTPGKVGSGSASITIASQPTQPKKGSGFLTTLTFKALSPSTSQINFDSSTQVAVVEKTTNAIQSVNGSQIVIANLITSSPTPISSFTPIPTQVLPTLTPTPIQIIISLTPTIVPTNPAISPTCTFAPPCAYANPPCPQPVGGMWCSRPTAVTPTTFACTKKTEGDANCDGKIDGIDYSIWINSQCHSFAGQLCADHKADFNGDGNVDDEDYMIWFRNHNS